MAAKAAMDAARLAAVMVRVHGPVSKLLNWPTVKTTCTRNRHVRNA